MDKVLKGIAQLEMKVKEYIRRESPLDFYEKMFAGSFEDDSIRNERDLVKVVLASPELLEPLRKYFDTVMEVFTNEGAFWADRIQADQQAGQVIAAELALHSEDYIRLLTAFTEKCDIDHEIGLDKQILAVWDKWGETEASQELVDAYCARSQHKGSMRSAIRKRKHR